MVVDRDAVLESARVVWDAAYFDFSRGGRGVADRAALELARVNWSKAVGFWTEALVSDDDEGVRLGRLLDRFDA